MRVLLVAPSLDPVTYKGLGRYSREIFKVLRQHADVDLIVRAMEEDKVVSTLTKIPLRVLTKGHYDVVHALSPEMGICSHFLPSRTVTTFHDLIPITANREMSFRLPFFMASYTRLTWQLAARADRIIVNSIQTRGELERILGVKQRKIMVVPLGVEDRFQPIPRTRQNRSLTVGFFGNYTYRKRVNLAVEAFKFAEKHIDAKLVLAGGEIKTAYQKHFNIAELVEGISNVEILHHVPESQLPTLYNSFDLMVFPSSYEGFGLPILEAQKCGVPVLILNDARIPAEVTKECIVCTDVNDMAAKTLSLLEDPLKRRRISHAGIEYASKFTWENTVKQTLEVYDELFNGWSQ